ncbi:MAG TPA: CocE/NonD family hydrolase [Phnomibacter sp.]|nr:CocE/NonD family hydrolase [Phnomibacter sp.]
MLAPIKRTTILLLSLVAMSIASAQNYKPDSAYIVNNYVKWEKMIPMRDGTQLFTSIYLPKDSSQKHPVLLTRTPYSCAPYGKDAFRALWNTNQGLYAMKNYIIVMQDVRGRFMSEGSFVDVRPHITNKTGTQTDEASDTYDTIDWLTKQLPGNNGNVGVFGISYPGFYSTMAALSQHPALKAVSPQAPVTDWFLGDDFHHNGALMLIDAFEFYKGFGVPRPHPTTKYNPGFVRKEKDAYQFFLAAGPLPQFTHQYLGDSIAFWNDLMQHGTYDDWWKARNPRNFVGNIKPAMLVIGGTFDAEDCFGAWNLYKAIEAQNASTTYNKIVMGPWFHGAWGGRSAGDKLGNVQFGSNTSYWYQQQIEIPFFEHFLNNKTQTDIKEATVFFTGANEWRSFETWPASQLVETPLYFQPYGKLSFNKPKAPKALQKPDGKNAFTSYVSDPMQPVPHEGTDTIANRTREYMTNDQRFAAKRKDVITFRTDVLQKPVTLGGPVYAELMVSTTSTDIDLVVKIIDEFPKDISTRGTGPDSLYRNQPNMNSYQMLVRGEVMRGKFRNSFEEPEAFVPNKITKVRFYLPDVAHTFLKGHRIMIQVQSSWFPLVDRNPQSFTDIYHATQDAFEKATISLFHTDGLPSKILLPILE